VAFDLAGFRPLVREGIVLTTGFAARLDVTLGIDTFVHERRRSIEP